MGHWSFKSVHARGSVIPIAAHTTHMLYIALHKIFADEAKALSEFTSAGIGINLTSLRRHRILALEIN